MTSSIPTEIAVRAYTEVPPKPVFDDGSETGQGGKKSTVAALDTPSPWTLVFDTETTTDPSQAVRIGFYQVRKSGNLNRVGVFYDRETVTGSDLEAVQSYGARHGLEVIELADFRRLFIRVGFKWCGTIVGFNLPFDISRIAMGAGEARRSMRGGFRFTLSKSRDVPAVRVKHLSRRAALIDFAAPMGQRTGQSGRKRGDNTPAFRGFFVDVKTLATALTSRSFSLETLCNFLKIGTRKKASAEHGGPLTEDYLDYARNDVQATWECYEKLLSDYGSHGLTKPAHRIISEASMGKAYLEDMGIAPFLTSQPDFPRPLIGAIMASYYGGRTEVNLRRTLAQVLYCDFKSMYPTVNVLMGLWRFVIAEGVTRHDATEETRSFLQAVQLQDFQSPEIWKDLTVLVKIRPDGDLLPVRAKYDGKSYTIGQNYLTCDEPLWFTLADLVAAKLRSGKTPEILEAIRFEPGPVQDGLRPINLFGNKDFHVDPARDDVFKRLVDLRDNAKKNKDPVQQAIKIIANATSYGIFIEIVRDNAPKPEPIRVYGGDGTCLETQSTAVEKPGKFFHPLLGTLITGAARLMLALSEQLTLDAGLDWVFCDTDSLAIARPEAMTHAEFMARAQGVIDWFVPLNPYKKPGSILQVEDINHHPETGEIEPLFAWAFSSKRYTLFNIGPEGQPVLRQASQHGLGHLQAPYGEDDPAPGIPTPSVPLAMIGLLRWQYDFWFKIVSAALEGHPNQVPLDYHPALARPALSRYGATSPTLLRWMQTWNRGKPYRDQVKPFGFLSAFTARKAELMGGDCGEIVDPSARGRPRKPAHPKPVAPYEKDPARAARNAYDRETGRPVGPDSLKTLAEALHAYPFSSEAKALVLQTSP